MLARCSEQTSKQKSRTHAGSLLDVSRDRFHLAHWECLGHFDRTVRLFLPSRSDEKEELTYRHVMHM